jgi:hypothetical protein
VVVGFDVVVDVDLGVPPGRELIALRRKRPKCGPIQQLEQDLARAVHLLERAHVDGRHAVCDRHVRLADRTKALVTQSGDDPTLGEEHAGFDLGLVGPRRDDRDAIVGCHLLVGGVHVGLVTVRPGDARTQVVADHDLVTAAHELEGVGVRGHPVQELLGGNGLREKVVRRAGDRHEQLGVECHFSRASVIDGDLLAREVDEELLAGTVHLAHDDVDASLPGPIQIGKLAVAITVGMVFAVLEPQQLQSDALSSQLTVHIAPVRDRPGDG